MALKEAKAVMTAAASFDNTYYAAFYRLLLLTACRSHEWIDCRWEDVDLDAGIMTAQRTKQGNVKVVPLVVSAVEVLSALPRIDDYVLPRPFSRSSKVLARFREQVGFSDWTPHDFRRTVASHLAEDDESIETIERLLDHTVEKGATKVYVRNKFTRQKQAALERGEGMLNA